MTMTRPDLSIAAEIAERGFSMRMPAGDHNRFTAAAAENLVGRDIDFVCDELGYRRRMEIMAVVVVDDGAAIDLTLLPA